MSISDLLHATSLVAGGISFSVISAGVIHGKYSLDMAREYYAEKLSDKERETLGKPDRLRIYFDSIRNTPRYIFVSVIKKPGQKNRHEYYAFNKYIERMEKIECEEQEN